MAKHIKLYNIYFV